MTATGSQDPRNPARPANAGGQGSSQAAQSQRSSQGSSQAAQSQHSSQGGSHGSSQHRSQHHSQGGSQGSDLAAQIGLVARGDAAAFDAVFEQIGPSVFGAVKRVIRDPAQSEEVTQEVLLEVWRNAAKFDAGRGSATAWVMTLAHRRAVDRVRSVQKESERERRIAAADIPYDEVIEAVESSLERERVRRCLNSLTELQRESVTLAYYRGYTYGQVATLLGVPTGTVKTRMRDALIRLRDCLGVAE